MCKPKKKSQNFRKYSTRRYFDRFHPVKPAWFKKVPKPMLAGALCNKIAINIIRPSPSDLSLYSLTIVLIRFYYVNNCLTKH